MTRILTAMRRALTAFLPLLVLLPGIAAANVFDSYVLATSPPPLDYWSLSANANDTGSGAINGTCAGTCDYGQALSTYASGYAPGTSTSYITINQSFSSQSQTIQLLVGLLPTTSTATQLLTNQIGSLSSSIDLQYSNPSCSGEFTVVVVDAASPTVNCVPGPVNDGNPHQLFVRCGSGVGLASLDGVEVLVFTCAFGSSQSTSYSIGGSSGGSPVLAAMGGLAYWLNATLLTNAQIYNIWTCFSAGNCPTSQPTTCPTHAGFAQQWCDNLSTFAICNQGGSYPWWAGAIGTYTTALNQMVASQAAATLTVSSFATGLPIAKQQYLYDNATAKVSGGCYDFNTVVGNGTYISAFGSGSGGSGTYTVAAPGTVSAEPMQTGAWLPFTYISTNLTFGGPVSIVVGQNGGGGGTGGWTARGLPAPMTVGTERIIDFMGWFRYSGAFAWNSASFGFGNQANAAANSGVGQQVFVKFGNGNSPPSGYVNFDVQIPVTGDIGNFNVSSNGWHDVVLDVNYQSTSAGFVKITVDGVPAFSWSGITAPNGALTGDSFFVFGQEAVTVDAEAYFGLIGAYAPASGTPRVIWLQ